MIDPTTGLITSGAQAPGVEVQRYRRMGADWQDRLMRRVDARIEEWMTRRFGARARGDRFDASVLSGLHLDLTYVVGDTANVVPSGYVSELVFDFDVYLARWWVTAKESGSIAFAISYEPAVGNTPVSVGGTQPNIPGGTYFVQDTPNWTKLAFARNQVLKIAVSSATTITRATLGLDFRRI